MSKTNITAEVVARAKKLFALGYSARTVSTLTRLPFRYAEFLQQAPQEEVSGSLALHELAVIETCLPFYTTEQIKYLLNRNELHIDAQSFKKAKKKQMTNSADIEEAVSYVRPEAVYSGNCYLNIVKKYYEKDDSK